MPQTERFLLPDIGDVDHVRDVAYYLQQVLLAFGFEGLLQLEADVKMILDRCFAAARDDDDVLNAGMDGFLDAVLDERLVHQRKHLFRLRLGGRKKASAESRSGENRLAYFWNHQNYCTWCIRAG